MTNSSWHNSSGVSNVSVSRQTDLQAKNITSFVLLEDFKGLKKNTGFKPSEYKVMRSKKGLEKSRFIIVKGNSGVDVEIPFSLLKNNADSIKEMQGEKGAFLILKNVYPFYKTNIIEGKLTKKGEIIAFNEGQGLFYLIPANDVSGEPNFKKIDAKEYAKNLETSLLGDVVGATGTSKVVPNDKAPEIAKAEVKTEPQSEGGLFANKKLVYGVIGVIAVIGIVGVLKYKKVI